MAPNTSLMFEIVVPLSLAIFSFVALGDPGKASKNRMGGGEK